MSWKSGNPFAKRIHNILIFLLLTSFFVNMLSPSAYTKGNGVQVLTGGPRFMETLPGRTVTIAFLVSNETRDSLELVEKLEMPAEWQKIIPLSSFRLPPGGETTRILAFHVPPSTPAGEHEITYMVRDRDRYAIQDGETIKIKVLPVEDVSVFLEDKPFQVIAGNPYEVRVRLINGGNSDETFQIKVQSVKDLPLDYSPSEISLKSGESERITINVDTPVDMETTRDYLKVEVYSRKDPHKRMDQLSIGVDIIGQIASRSEPYHFIPTTLSIFTGGDSGDDGDVDFYLQWRGYGSIDEEGTRLVDFLFRFPDTDGGGFFSERDEYYLNYYQPDLDIFLGDQGYDLSGLTANYTYGRGYGINYRPGAGDFEIGAYYVEDRDEPAEKEKGFHTSYRVNEDLDLRLNYLDKRELENSRHVKDEIWSLEADYFHARYGQLLVEYGISDSTRPDSEEDSAYLIEYNSTIFDNVSLYANRIHAGIDYEGYYNGYDYTSAYVGFPLSSRLRMSLSYVDYQDLVDPDETRTRFNSDRTLEAALDYTFDNGWYANLGYENFKRVDQLEPRDDDYTVNSVWLRIGRSMAIWSYMVEIRRGEKKDHLADESTTGWNYRVFVTHRPSASLLLSLFADFGDDSIEDVRGLRTTSRLGFSAYWQIRENWLINFWYSKSRFDSDRYDEEDEYEIQSFYTFDNGHSLELALRHEIREDDEDETEFRLTYNIPIKIKTEKKKDLGSIEGRIYDAQIEGNPGIENIIVKCQGRTTLTDSDGAFILSPLLPGEHVLEIDRHSIGWNRVPVMQYPGVYEIKGMGETTHMEIGIADKCTLHGKVVAVAKQRTGIVPTGSEQEEALSLVGSGKAEEFSYSGALPNILVEVRTGNHAMRKFTDDDGEFRFENLYPADWVLTVYENSLPPQTYVENAQEFLVLEPGQEITLTKKVLPKVRSIKMLVKEEKITSKKASGKD
ncbi:MAG: hypothetical protein JW971_03070 [Synergistales bacterium]|nr:hypothetical protein [Synergistales bacterium]